MVVPVLTKLGVSLPALRAEADRALEDLPRLGEGSSTEGGQPSSELTAVLREAEKQAKDLSDEYISTEHLLLALAGDKSRAGQALRAVGASRDRLLQALAEVRGPHRVTDQSPEEKYQALERFGRDFTKLAEEGVLDPVIGRDEEIRRVIQVLSPTHEEQPGADRRAGRRQDRDRRGPRPADRLRRRPRVTARTARDRARHRLADRRRQVPG